MSVELLAMIPPIASADGWVWLLLLSGPAGGGLVYWTIYRYYRNTDKSHSFEEKTRVGSQPVQGQDHKVRSFRGIKRSSLQGRNETNHRARVQRR